MMGTVRRSVAVGIGSLRFASVALLFPWVLLHELAHYVAAHPWSDEASLTVYPPRVSVSFENSSRYVSLLVGLAPTIVGYTIAMIWFVGLGWRPALSNAVDLYLLLGWIVLTTPSPRDVSTIWRK
ncbi:hypothetical protein AB7C87_01820 [Natrarchaeobius sp. A-rgal3]|uniref:hypothetical protein n=1 Tax=Natrarchaeobius versutus TaxID=1679078 RepID=UPI00350EECB0